MPSTATITAFNTFVAGTRARAADVNTNFTNFRGHIVPTNADTQTASNNTHDLGATDHQWRRLYLQEPPYIGGVQAAKLNIETVYDGSTPAEQFDDIKWLGRSGFSASTNQDIVFSFVVTPEYKPTTRLGLTYMGYGDTTGGFSFRATVALYRPATTGVTAPATVLTLASVNTNYSVAGQFFSESNCKLSETNGTIGVLTTAVGDVIAVSLQRLATTDTNTGYIYLTNFVVDLNAG